MANLSDVIYKMIDNAHPVGSYYLTETDTNPSAILHVGTWVQLKDRMLIGCGDSFAISSEGGEKEHTLAFNELPQHTHGAYIDVGFSAHPTGNTNEWKQYLLNTRTAPNGSVNIQTNGIMYYNGTSPFNLMNPYHVCYIWRRTA